MKDNFDDILKNKWEQFHFPVDDKHRQEMIALLDNQKRRRPGLLWWWSGLATIIAGVAIFVLLQQSHPSAGPDRSLQLPTVSGKQAPVASSKNTQHENEYNEEVPRSEVNDADISAASEFSTNSAPTSSSSSSSSSKPSVSSSSTISSKPSSMTDKSQVEKTKNEQTKKLFQNKISDKTFADRDKTVNLPDTKVEQETTATSESILETNSIAADNEQFIAGAAEEALIVDRNNDITSFLPGLHMHKLEYSLHNDITSEATIINKKPIRLFAEGGAGLVFGSKSDFSSGWTINFGGGLDYGFNKRTHLVFSGGYLFQNGGFDFQRSSTVEQLTFGARSSFHTLTPEKLHFVYAKTGLHHRIQRHVISVLGGVKFLYGAQGDIVLQVNDQISGPSIDDSRKNVWLKLDGMQQFLFNTEVLYGYQITPKLSLHSGIRYNFNGIEVKDPELTSRGFYWNGKYSRVTPFFTLNYQLYGTR